MCSLTALFPRSVGAQRKPLEFSEQLHWLRSCSRRQQGSEAAASWAGPHPPLGPHLVLRLPQQLAQFIIGHPALEKLLVDRPAQLLQRRGRLREMLNQAGDVRWKIFSRRRRPKPQLRFCFRGNRNGKCHRRTGFLNSSTKTNDRHYFSTTSPANPPIHSPWPYPARKSRIST